MALSRGSTLLCTRSFLADRGHSQILLPAVESAFAEAGLRPADVELFAAVVGPGSFTGLRVSLACVRGLAGGRPCLGAVATDVVAWAARGRDRRVLALVDLFHGEVFGAVHDAQGALLSRHESGDLEAVLTALKPFLEADRLAAGSAAVRHRDAMATAIPGLDFLELPEGLAPHLASLAISRNEPANLCSSSDLLPFYLRDPLTRGLLATQPKSK